MAEEGYRYRNENRVNPETGKRDEFSEMRTKVLKQLEKEREEEGKKGRKTPSVSGEESIQTDKEEAKLAVPLTKVPEVSKPPTGSEELRRIIDQQEAFENSQGGRRGTRKAPRKVRILIKHEGDLSKLGYSLGKSARSRHASLKKAVKRYGRLSTSRKLNALAVFNKRRHPQTARKARADRKFVMK
jgi:hypothetical protein